MVEVIQIHLFKNGYPFGLEYQGQTTFVQVFRPNLTQTEIQQYRKNLQIFKALKCAHIIALDKFVKQDNSLHIYYKYKPQSLRSHLKNLSKSTRSQNIHNTCAKLVNQINEAIQCIIKCLINSRIMANLSLQNVAIDEKLNIQIFIEPQIEVLLEQSRNTNNNEALKDYYLTEKKKLHIQFQQELQQIFGKKKEKNETINSPNFIIKGTKLVFISENQLKKNQDIPNKIKNGAFDINNILDKNKMQKNKQNRQNHDQSSQSNQKKQKKILNYFNDQVNDNYTKDASFYPQQFTKQDTFADIQAVCYEEELQKELQQLKKKEKQKKQKILHQKQQQQKYNRQSFTMNNNQNQKNKLSNSNQMVSKKHINDRENTQGSIKNRTCPNNSNEYTLSSNQNSRDHSHNNSHNDSYNSQPQKTKNKVINNGNDPALAKIQKQKQKSFEHEIKQQNSIQDNKKKKYKMKIITSHEVQIEDDGSQNFDIKNLEKQIVNDIKKGTNGNQNNNNNYQIKDKDKDESSNNKQNFNKPNTNSSNQEPVRSGSSYSTKNIEIIQEKVKGLQRPSTSKKNQDKNQHVNHPFSKVNHGVNSTENYQSTQGSYLNQIKASYNEKHQKHQGKEDTAKLIQRFGLKQHKKNQDLINARQTICVEYPKKEEEHTESNLNQNIQQEQQYLSKIQKAKNKAEQIMKIVKARKHNEHQQ